MPVTAAGPGGGGAPRAALRDVSNAAGAGAAPRPPRGKAPLALNVHHHSCFSESGMRNEPLGLSPSSDPTSKLELCATSSIQCVGYIQGRQAGGLGARVQNRIDHQVRVCAHCFDDR